MADWIMDQGVPGGDPAGIFAKLARGRSSLILPAIEDKIERILRAPHPLDCFTDKTVDVSRTVLALWSTIANVGDRQALVEASKLLKIDEKRFDRIVFVSMAAAMSAGDEFTLAYQGFDLGDPAIDQRILREMEGLLEDELPKIGNPIYENAGGPRHEWAEALVDRYGGAPTEAQWSADPIASRLKPDLRRGLHNDVIRFAIDVAQERARKERK